MKHIPNMKNKQLVVLSLAGIVIVLATILLRRGSTLGIEETARLILETCREEGHKPSCYDREIPKVLDYLTMEEAFAVTAEVQNADSGYGYCHILGHNISAIETKKNPDAWKDVVSRCPSGVCSNGCIHGAFQERFRSDVVTSETEFEQLLAELDDVCEARENWSPTDTERGSCYHALGHLLMLATGADIQQSLRGCDTAARMRNNLNPTQLCYDGAFMQIFQPLEPEDFALIAGKEITDTAQHKAFCAQFSGKQRGSCWTEGWPLHLDDISTGAGLTAFCDHLTDDEKTRCYRSIVYAVFPLMQLKEELMISYCSSIPDSYQAQCFGDAASRLLEIDWHNIERAVGLCALAHPMLQQDCYNSLSQMAGYNFPDGSDEQMRLCAALPLPWSQQCPSD